jgi:hypothetical protein
MASDPVYTVVLSSKAQNEIAASWQWYEEREHGLGDRLMLSVMQKLNAIAKNPAIFSIKRKPYREANISVFPFLIVYKINKNQKLIEVASVFHTSRNPKKKY